METYCVSCKRNTVNENSRVRKAKQNRLMLLSNCTLCGKKIINKTLLTGDKFMEQLHLKEPGFPYSACGTFSKHRERIQKFRKTENVKNLYRNELNKACFAHDASYSDSKDLAKRTISDKILKDIMNIKEH